MGLTRLAIRRPLTILMVILGLVLMGAIAYTHLNVDRLPPIDVPFLGINLAYPGAAAQDVEQLVAEPVENALSGMSGVDQITSNSSEGKVTVTVQFANGTNVDAAAIDAGRRIQSIQRSLPTQVSAPSIFEADPNATPILDIAVSGAPLDQLYDVAVNSLQPDLESVPGVAQVNLSGGLQREIRVTVDYAKLAAYGLTTSQVSSAIAAQNVTQPLGSINQGNTTLNLRSVAAAQNVQDIGNIIVATTAAGPVHVSDVSTVTDGDKTATQLQRLNGQDAVGMEVVKQSDANELKVADEVKAELVSLRSSLPQGATISVTSDDSVYTRASLDAIQRDLLIAVALVGVVMMLFLHQWKNTAIVLFAVPTVLISTFLFMFAFGFTLNIMTLMAVALMIGILVDDSIVVLENIHRHFELGETAIDAAINGRSEIGLAAIAITMADVIVYVPIAFVSGTVGQLFREYGLTVVVATILSLLISFTLTPMVASRWLRHRQTTGGGGPFGAFGRWWDRGFDRVAGLFAQLIPFTLRVRWLVVVGVVGLLVLSALMIKTGLIGSEYAPEEDNGNLQVNLTMPANASLTATDAATRLLEARVQQLPGVVNVFTSVSSGGFSGSPSASLAVDLVPKTQRKQTIFVVAQEIRDLGKSIPASSVTASISSPLAQGGGGGSTTSVSLLVQGPDSDTLNQVATQVEAAGKHVAGLTPILNTGSASVPELDITPNATLLGQAGISAQQFGDGLSTDITGTVVSELRVSGQEQEDIAVLADPSVTANPASLSAAPIGAAPAAAAGQTAAPSDASARSVVLGDVATLAQGTGPVQIQRVNRSQTLSLRAQAVGRPLGSVASDLQKEINALNLPAGYSVTLAGQVQQLNQAISALTQALVLAIVLEYMLLVALYQSWFYPLVRMMAVPLGLFGALVGLLVTGNTLNIFSIIGLVMAEGLVAKSSILLIDYTNTLRGQGLGRTEALVEAARTRLRPILMTSATMVFGMLPLALKLEAGAESRAPIAVVVMGALISSTFLTLLVVPALYTLFDDLSMKSRGIGSIFPGRARTEAVGAAEPERQVVPS